MIAKKTLESLITDGRIHPSSIEEAFKKASENIHHEIIKYGEEAALTVGIIDLHPDIIKLLGQLNFRSSYGQNVLSHSLEVSRLMGIMAAELQLDVILAKRIGLLHDMGKSVTHEKEGSHAIIGHELALQYGESEVVANGIGSHHHEMKPITIEGSLCSAADSISASRPGARIEAVDQYIKRLTHLEAIARSFEGVEEAYALQAGRELRINITPEKFDDQAMYNLAQAISKKIENKLTYPGRIKILLIKEKRVVEYAV